MSENIQVVVRCRARNRQEVAAKSPIIVELPHEEHSSDEPFVTVTNGPLSTLTGTSRTTAGKVYKVDQVYGPNADQALLFNNVASPLFHDFISGLNVTILAYGQTGSGKTYSMFGDLSGENSGIIPRVLTKLFASIDTDHMVKISCVELYNEDLHDLINSSPSKPNLRLVGASGNSKQPTFIQNLKEVHIHSSEVGFNILKKCLERRRTSATRLNDISSRSHTIFSINLFRKKSASSGGDVYVKSTMNLVDLAGSEDINRSGAINERAREAGSINQSLLTLGKVISTLSEGKESRHVPYRDSKLTRILQGSIGGQTKTALIATISPAKVNVSETLSTLNYASKAKNIKNIPQSISENETMNKSVLIKDLSEQLSRLEEDRRSSADKDGHVKISLQNYKEYCNAKVEHDTIVKEQDSQIAKLTSKLQAKSTENDSFQKKIQALEAQIKHQSHEIDFKDSQLSSDRLSHQQKIGELTSQIEKQTQELESKDTKMSILLDEVTQTRDELSTLQEKILKQQNLGIQKQQEFATTMVNLHRKLDDIIDNSFSFVSSNALGLTDSLDKRKAKLTTFLTSAHQSILEELNKFEVQFGEEWKRELTQRFDISQNIEKIKSLDVSPELCHIEKLESLVNSSIRTTLLLEAHEEAINSATRDMIQKQNSIKEDLLRLFKMTLDSAFNANNSDICNSVKNSVTNVLSESKSKASEALETFSNGRLHVTKEIASKAEAHAKTIAEIKEELQRKTDGAGARIYEETGIKISRGIQSIIDVDTKQSNDCVKLVNNCFDETTAAVNKSKDTFKADIEATKRSIHQPLTEIKENNIPQISPKRKVGVSGLRSPQRYSAADAKRRKILATNKDDLELFRSQIPQLYPGRK